MAGPHCALEIGMYTDFAPSKFPRQLGRLDTLDDVKNFMMDMIWELNMRTIMSVKLLKP